MSPGLRAFRPSARARAFTLAELVVSIAILILLFTFSIRAVLDMNRRARLRNSAERVANTLGLARSLAISENFVHHVRVENRSRTDQWVGVYRFGKITDALSAMCEANVCGPSAPGAQAWNPRSLPGNLNGQPYTNVVVEKQRLEPGICFETCYDPAALWDMSKSPPKLRRVDELHKITNYHDLFYSGGWAQGDPLYPTENFTNPPYPVYTVGTLNTNLLPKTNPVSAANSQITTTAPADRLLFFYPDGTASDNVLLLLRDDYNLFYVQVWRGGTIRMGEIAQPADFTRELNGH